jgi:hypothetical protein
MKLYELSPAEKEKPFLIQFPTIIYDKQQRNTFKLPIYTFFKQNVFKNLFYEHVKNRVHGELNQNICIRVKFQLLRKCETHSTQWTVWTWCLVQHKYIRSCWYIIVKVTSFGLLFFPLNLPSAPLNPPLLKTYITHAWEGKWRPDRVGDISVLWIKCS